MVSIEVQEKVTGRSGVSVLQLRRERYPGYQELGNTCKCYSSEGKLGRERCPGHWKPGNTYSSFPAGDAFSSGIRLFCSSPGETLLLCSTKGASLQKCSSSVPAPREVVTFLPHSTPKKEPCYLNLIQVIHWG